jgi:hypothetical protein
MLNEEEEKGNFDGARSSWTIIEKEGPSDLKGMRDSS